MKGKERGGLCKNLGRALLKRTSGPSSPASGLHGAQPVPLDDQPRGSEALALGSRGQVPLKVEVQGAPARLTACLPNPLLKSSLHHLASSTSSATFKSLSN